MLGGREGHDFPIRNHYGAEIVNHHGLDMTGMSTADEQSTSARSSAALYTRPMLSPREGALAARTSGAESFVRLWRRLVGPDASTARATSPLSPVDHFVPDNELSGGLEDDRRSGLRRGR